MKLVKMMFTALMLISSMAVKAADKPNFIVIFIDDQGYQDLGCFGSPNIKTPFIDQMAKEGMRFTDFYSAASVCTPSRGSLLTGRYPDRLHGARNVLFPNAKHGLTPNEITIAEVLKTSGYSTSCICKWHLGHKEKFLPTSQGFDSYYGIPYSNDMSMDYDMKLADDIKFLGKVTKENFGKNNLGNNYVPLMRNTEVIEFPADQNTITKRFTEEAVKFIDDNKEKPFFLYLAHTMPHVPLYTSPEFEGKSEAGRYGDCIEEIDWSTGQIIAALKKNGLDKNTLVIYTSDNGPWNFRQNKTSKVKGHKDRRVGGSALPLRGYKFQCWEGGMRVPAVMWWPGKIPAGTVSSEIAATIDILPSLAELSGSELPSKLDGKSFIPLIEGKEGAKSAHKAYFYRTKGVRSGKWKLLDSKLFDLVADIGETKDMKEEYPEVYERLRSLLKAHEKDIFNK